MFATLSFYQYSAEQKMVIIEAQNHKQLIHGKDYLQRLEEYHHLIERVCQTKLEMYTSIRINVITEP